MKVKQLCKLAAIPLAIGLFSPNYLLAQSVAFEESFASGLGSFSASGRVYTGSYGVRMRGGGYFSSGGAITSGTISLADYTDLTLAYDRSTSGLDAGESFTVAYSVNGGAFNTLESSGSASGRTTINLPSAVDGESVVLRFSLDASSFFETFVVDDIVVEGTLAGGNDDDDDDDDNDNDNGTLPPVDRIDTNGPLQTTQHRNVGAGGDGWVVHPSNIGSHDFLHPIFVWGPGAGTGPSDYDFFLDRLASHGFVVYSEVSTGDGDEMEDAIDWLIAENNRPGSRYYQQLDTDNIAIGGHSRGSLSAFGIADDSRLSTTVHVAGGTFFGDGPGNLRNPTLYVAGEDDTLATGNMEDDYDDTDVPVFFTIMDNVDHIMAAREGMPIIVAWLRWHLGAEDFRSGDFLDPACDFCTGVYDSTSKNW